MPMFPPPREPDESEEEHLRRVKRDRLYNSLLYFGGVLGVIALILLVR